MIYNVDMRRLLFFSRVAFICNICFIAGWLMAHFHQLSNDHLSATIVVLGYGFAFFLNLATTLIYLIFIATRHLSKKDYPLWLMVTNFLFLLIQLTVYFL